MRVVIQRVKKARTKVGGKIVGEIGQGLLVLLAVHQNDKESVVQKMAEKVINLRIFGDKDDKMNLSVKDIGGEIMVVSQFTLYGNCQKGNRPSFIESAKPEKAILFYEKFVKYIREQGIKVETGEFGAQMSVELVNDGPVTIIIDL
jgi:D-tyrosyl-tRNA(Tyr) deacylase